MRRVTARELATLTAGLDLDPSNVTSVAALAAAIGPPDDTVSYLILGVLGARVPTVDEVRTFTREWRASDLETVITTVIRTRRRTPGRRSVRVVRDCVVDVTDTARSLFTTGIQRVARETLSRWSDDEVHLVVWDVALQTFVDANDHESARASLGTIRSRGADVVIPFHSSLFLPEIAVNPARASALRTLASHSGSATVAVGFDCIPVTTAETAGPGMPGAFSRYLSTLARFSLVLPISEAAGSEFSGWRDMLAGAGLTGPEIAVLPLPTDTASATSPAVHHLPAGLNPAEQPIVLGVGSREPRKNHLNFLHACELNWRAGRDFAVVLVGGNSWESRRVDDLISDLQRRDRTIASLSGVDDDSLQSLYRHSRFSVFCSVNEGFGLPVVESLSYGTPVITSDFGSMRQLGEGRGAMLVDPHNPQAMADAIATLLDDDAALATLAAELRQTERRTWGDYAREARAAIERAQRSTEPKEPAR